MSIPNGHFDVTYLSTRSSTAGHVWGVNAPSDTVFALDRSAEVSAFGAGSLSIDLERLVLAGQRTVRSKGATLAAGVMAIGVGFLIAVMWQGERWPPLALAVLAILVAGCAFLFVRAKRIEPFRWVVPWRDVSSFTEMHDDVLEWLVTVKGQNVGTLPFGVVGGRSEELADLLIQVHESGLAKVHFLAREVPDAAVVVRSTR